MSTTSFRMGNQENPRASRSLARLLFAALTFLSLPETKLAAQPPAACQPIIELGKWNLVSLAVTNRTQGSWVADGTSTVLDGEIVTRSTPDPALTFFRVDCSNNVTGAGKHVISGRVVETINGGGVVLTTTITYQGEETYTFTGTVQNGPGGKPLLDLNSRTTTGSLTTRTVTEIAPSVPGFPQTRTETTNLVGSTQHILMPVLDYDEASGTLTADLKNSSLLEIAQAQINAIGSGQFFTITYSGAAAYENVSPVIRSIEPQYHEFFLKDIQADNPVEVVVRWHKAPEPHTLRLKYGATDITTNFTGSTITIPLDMATPAKEITGVATAPGETSDPVTVSLTKVPLPEWAKPAKLTSAPAVRYSGTLNWPPKPDLGADFQSFPIIGGLWNLLVESGKNDLEIKAHSQGDPKETGKLDWRYHFGLPFAKAKVDLTMEGTSSSTLGPVGMKMEGDATLKAYPFPLVTGVTVGLTTLIPGSEAAICGLSSFLCDWVQGIGLTAALQFDVVGKGTFRATESDTEPHWTTGKANMTLEGAIVLSLLPKSVSKYANVKAYGKATACMTVQFIPQLAVQKIGAELEAGCVLQILGVGILGKNYVWPLPFGGCSTPAPPVPLGLHPMSGINPSGIPDDGQASIALGPNQTMAVVWSGLTGTNTRPSGDIFLQLSDQDGSKAPVQLTQDLPADSAPQAAFDKNGRLVIAWQRNPSTKLPADISGLTAFAKGFEIAYAIFDPKTTNVLSTGLMTTNSNFDFSPDLFASDQGDVMLAWQRTDGESLSGSAEHPLSLHSAGWNGTNWGPTETVITNLTGTYGWSGALASPNEAAIAISLDLDSLMATDKDREIGLILRTNGVWLPLQRLTTNNLPDVGPQLTYLPDHRLALGWLQGDQVVGLAGDMKAAPRTWIRPNDLLGQGFLQAQLIANGTNLFAVWPCARDLYTLRIPLDQTAPADPAPQPLKFGQDDVETTFTARLLDDGSIRYGALSTEIIRGLTPQLAPVSSVITETVTFVQPGTGPRIVSVTSPTNGKVSLSWESIPGRVYVIQRSENLTTWADASEFTATANLSRIDTDASSTGNTRFFRLVLKP